MQVRNFIDSDIPHAAKIAHRVWGELYTSESQELQDLIYEFMVHFYDLNREFSLGIYEEKLNGFLLAATKQDKNESEIWFKEKVKNLQDLKEQKIANDLLEYLNTSGNSVKKCMNDDDIMIGLFISQEKGCGKALLTKLTEICKEKNIKNIYLWTDTTCDHHYYDKNKFTLVNEVETLVNGQNIKTIVYKKEI